MEITNESLNEYCEYLIENYILLNPHHYDDSRIYIQLKEFRDNGEVKDIIYKNTKKEIKGEWLGLVAEQINIFFNDHTSYMRKYKIEKLIGNKQ